MSANSVLDLVLSPVKDLGLEARLHNRSNASVWLLLDADLQPSRLTLTGPNGRTAQPFDERTRRKFDTSVSDAMYTEIAAGSSVVLASESFELSSGTYELKWGPYLFSELPPGSWRAQVELESKITWVTKGGQEQPAQHRVWKGKLQSNELTITLPARGGAQ